MTRSSVINGKGQITVPLEIRNRLGLKTGDRAEFVVDGNQTIIRPARTSDENPFVKYVGALPVFAGATDINVWVRTLRDEKKTERR